jgi:hypothetical protein
MSLICLFAENKRYYYYYYYYYIGVKEWVQFLYLNRTSLLIFIIFVLSVEVHARFVNLFVLIFVWIVTVYLLKLFCSATVPLCDTIDLSRARHIRLTSIDASK